MDAKIILLLVVFAQNALAGEAGIESTLELHAFEDFLQHNNNLKQAIIVLDNTTEHLYNGNHSKEQWLNLLTRYRTRIYNLATFSQHNGKVAANMKFVSLFYFGSHRIGIFVPQFLNSAMQEHIFNVAAFEGLFNNSLAWFIVSKPMNNFEQTICETFGKLSFHVNADITVAVKTSSTRLLLYDVYKKCRFCTHSVQIEFKGEWTVEDGYQLLTKFKSSFVQRRRNLNRTQVYVGTTLLKKPPDVNYLAYLMNRTDNLQLDIMQRKSFRFFQDMEALYNMTLNITYTTAYGGILPAHNWTGILGELTKERLEFSINPIRMTLERLIDFKYTPQYHIENINMLLRHPRRNGVRNIFISPLATTVWWCILAVIFLTVLLLALHIRFELQQQQRTTNPQLATPINHIVAMEEQAEHAPPIMLETRADFIVLIILESIFNQGPGSDIFALFSTRFLIFTSGVFSVILMQYYGAFIVGSLLAEAPRTITTPKALYESNFDIGMENVTYNFDIFNKTSDPVSLRIFRERICKQPKRSLLSLEKGAERIKRGNFAFQTNVQAMYRVLLSMLSQSEFCDLQEIHISEPFALASPILKNCSYSEYLSQAIIKYRTTGLMDYNNINWKVPMPNCNANKNNEVEVDMEHFAPALEFICYAIALSFAVFLFELLYFYCLRRCLERLAFKRNN